MNKNILFLILVLGIISGLGYAFLVSRQENDQSIFARDHRFEVEVVDTPRARALGLGGREALCPECAMLFIFPENRIAIEPKISPQSA